MSRHKIGARCLSEEEAKQILPTYGKIREQINFFREELTNFDTKENEMQKTNNIGIIGVRGAGKTSILKTIREELKENNVEDRDIILPIIIPENMSESSTLMATILGMLGEEVTKREKKQKREIKQKCKDISNNLRNIYIQTVKQYTFIQKEYRDILIKEYTTENDYAYDCAKVFNSDTEFITKFHELINALLDSDLKKEGLIFIFIDDIDLSTYRCAEVVKTLLSYLSNERIVTFISGDLDTFKEALTLDFLRKDNIMDNFTLNTSILEGKEITILESKQRLSYEYLKKILPPMYRHNIKQWSLEEKGQYKILEEKGKSYKNLSELLEIVLVDWIDMSFFFYKDEKEIESLPYTYHLFDDTSRGLNNVYCVLEEITEKINKNKEKNDYQEEKKQLIDTIIASKPIYNQYRDEIQRRMIVIGNVKEENKVFFDNAKAIIYKINHSQEKGEYEKNSIERFSLFVLVDFVARILYEKEYQSKIKQDDSYSILKEAVMKDLLCYPIIAEKVSEYSCYMWYTFNEEKGFQLRDVNKNFLLKGDFVFNLAYYKGISLKKIIPLYQKEEMKETVDLKYPG